MSIQNTVGQLERKNRQNHVTPKKNHLQQVVSVVTYYCLDHMENLNRYLRQVNKISVQIVRDEMSEKQHCSPQRKIAEKDFFPDSRATYKEQSRSLSSLRVRSH